MLEIHVAENNAVVDPAVVCRNAIGCFFFAFVRSIWMPFFPFPFMIYIVSGRRIHVAMGFVTSSLVIYTRSTGIQPASQPMLFDDLIPGSLGHWILVSCAHTVISIPSGLICCPLVLGILGGSFGHVPRKVYVSSVLCKDLTSSLTSRRAILTEIYDFQNLSACGIAEPSSLRD